MRGFLLTAAGSTARRNACAYSALSLFVASFAGVLNAAQDAQPSLRADGAKTVASAAQLGIPEDAEVARMPGYIGATVVKDPQRPWVRITVIDPVGPLALAGLKVGDLLLSAKTLKVDGENLFWENYDFSSPQTVDAWLRLHTRGQEATIVFMRLDQSATGTSSQVKIRLERAPEIRLAPHRDTGANPSLPPIIPSLAAALKQEPPRPSLTETLNYAADWGVLAKLAGRVYRTTSKDDSDGAFSEVCDTFMRDTGCFVTIFWQEPGKSIVRSWYSDTGRLVATDLIEAGSVPGIFRVVRRYGGDNTVVNNTDVLATANDLIEGGMRYTVMSTRPWREYDDLSLSLMTTKPTLGLYAVSRQFALNETAEIVAHIAQMKKNEDWERRQAKRAETMATIYGGLQAVGQVVDEGRRQSENSFNATIAYARAQGDQQAADRASAQQRAVQAAVLSASKVGQGNRVAGSNAAAVGSVTSNIPSGKVPVGTGSPRLTASMASSGSANSSTKPSARKLTMFCFAFGTNNHIQFRSQRGYRNVSVDAQQAWQAAMKEEFAGLTGAPLNSVFCHFNETGEQFNAEPQATNDNAALIQWAPH